MIGEVDRCIGRGVRKVNNQAVKEAIIRKAKKLHKGVAVAGVLLTALCVLY